MRDPFTVGFVAGMTAGFLWFLMSIVTMYLASAAIAGAAARQLSR